MKRLLHYSSLLLMVILFAACSSGQEELVKKLYANVPAESEFVADVNIARLLKDTGAKTGKDGVTGAETLINLLASDDPTLKKDLEWACSLESGISPEAGVVFYHKGRVVLHFFLSDADKFRRGLTKQKKIEWSKSTAGKSTVYMGGDVAVVEDMAFMCDGMTADYVASLLNLSEVESFNGVDYSSKMAAADNGVNFWGSIDGLLGTSGLGFATKTQVKMMLGMFFNNPKYLVGSIDVNKKEVLFDTYVLDNNLKPSKCELEMSKIDPAQVAALDGNANLIFALAVGPKLIKQINNVASSAGGALPGQFSELISPIDGTIAFASQIGLNDKSEETLPVDYRLSVPTNGKQNAALSQFLQAFGSVTVDGNTLNVSKGSYGDGRLSLEAVSKEMKDAWLGMAFSIDNMNKPAVTSGLFTIVPSEGTMKLKLKFTLF